MARPVTVSAAIDQAAIREIAMWRDPSGILSVYIDAGPDRLRGNPAPVALTVRGALDGLQERAEGALVRTLAERVEALEPTLDQLRDPRAHGCGRALFAAVEGGDIRSFSVQVPMPDAADLAPRARVRPLLHAAAAGRPAGFVLVSRHGLRVVDWRFGDADELEDIPVSDPRDAWEDLPPGGRAAHVPNAGDNKDLRDRRAAVWVTERLQAATGRLGALAMERGWADMVLAGDVQTVSGLADALPSNAPAPILDPRVLEWRGAADAADLLLPVLLTAREQRSRDLVREALDFAAAGGRGAVGGRDVLAALALGRVEHLLVDVTATPSDADLDELVGLAVETDAAVTALDPLTADGSGTTAAAILRW